MISQRLGKYLDDLERRIDAAVEDDLVGRWTDFWEGRFDDGIFSPRRSRTAPPGLEWPAVRLNEAIEDFELMALHQLRMCSEQLAAGGGHLLAVRSNYGTGILPSVFGVEMFIMPEETDTLPTSRPVGTIEGIQAILDRGDPDPHGGFGGRTLEMAHVFEEIRRWYPKIGRYVHHYHPDLQGPMDVCELLWGSGLFVDLYERPAMIHALLDLVTRTYIRFLREWLTIAPQPQPYTCHWGLMQRGTIMLRDDSAMNLSPEMFDEFIRPYNRRVLDEFGGGSDHFCGRGDHFIGRLTRIEGLYAVQMSQPHLNDMETIFRHTVDRGIKLLGMDRETAETAETALAAGRDLHGCVHCG